MTNDERTLWQTVLNLAIDDALQGARDSTSAREQQMHLTQCTRTWFTWPNADFAFVCTNAGGQLVARVSLDLHIWAIEDGPDTAKRIGYQTSLAVMTLADQQDGFEIDGLDQPTIVYIRDPQPEIAYTHGVQSVEAVIRWRT